MFNNKYSQIKSENINDNDSKKNKFLREIKKPLKYLS